MVIKFSEEQQLAEMIEIIKPFVSGLACEEESGSCELTDCRSCNARCLANAILEKDYGKQLKGEWVAKETMIRTPSARNYYCSVCKYEPAEALNFCPQCGAKMK